MCLRQVNGYHDMLLFETALLNSLRREMVRMSEGLFWGTCVNVLPTRTEVQVNAN